MATRASLAATIADDLDRSDLTTQIDAAISDAVARYESERFVFNEAQNITHTFSSSVDVVLMTELPVYFVKIDRFRMRYAGSQNLSDLIPRDYQWLMDGQDAKALCRPLEYCIYANALNFDSLPDQSYVGIIDGVRRLASATSTASDAGAWFNDARNLIRARAKVDLNINVIRDAEEAVRMQAVEDREYRMLKQKLNTRASGRVRPTEF